MPEAAQTNYLDVARAGSGLIQSVGQGVSRYQRTSDLAKRLRPLQAQQTNTAMLSTALSHDHFTSNLKRRRNLITDVARLRSPENIQERSAKKKGFTGTARGIASMAKASGVQGAILDAARATRKGARSHREWAVQQAWKDAEQAVEKRVQKAQTQAAKAEARRQRLMNFFSFYNRYMESKKAEAGAKGSDSARATGALAGAASGALSGAAAGSVVPVVGPLIGGVVGGLVGGIGGYFS